MEKHHRHITRMEAIWDSDGPPLFFRYGKDLMEVTIDIPEAPGPVLLRYSRIET